jgi:ketosteroid isomerase-like protein
MSEENVKFVRALFESVAGQDLVSAMGSRDSAEAKLAFDAAYSPDLEITWIDSNPDSGVYHGFAGYQQAFADWLDAWEEFSVEPKEFIDAGDHVLIPNVQRGRGKGSGVEIEEESTLVYTVRDRRVVRISEYASLKEAVKAAGLQE